MARSKRIALTLDAEYHELLKVIADYQGKKVTTVVKDFMNSSRTIPLVNSATGKLIFV